MKEAGGIPDQPPPPPPPPCLLIASLSNVDGDGNGNDKKALG